MQLTLAGLELVVLSLDRLLQLVDCFAVHLLAALFFQFLLEFQNDLALTVLLGKLLLELFDSPL